LLAVILNYITMHGHMNIRLPILCQKYIHSDICCSCMAVTVIIGCRVSSKSILHCVAQRPHSYKLTSYITPLPSDCHFWVTMKKITAISVLLISTMYKSHTYRLTTPCSQFFTCICVTCHGITIFLKPVNTWIKMHLWICEGQTNRENTQCLFNAEHDHHYSFVSWHVLYPTSFLFVDLWNVK